MSEKRTRLLIKQAQHDARKRQAAKTKQGTQKLIIQKKFLWLGLNLLRKS